MLLFGHGRILPVIEKLTGQLSAFATGFEAVFVDRAVIDGAALDAEGFNVEGSSSAGLATVAALFFQVTRVTVDSAR